MAMQARARGTSEWYRPDRDLVYALSPMLRAALESFGPEHVTAEELPVYEKLSSELGAIVRGSIERTLPADELQKRYTALLSKYKPQLDTLNAVVVQTLLLRHNRWCAEMLPQKPDGTIDRAALAAAQPVSPPETPKA